MWSMCGGRRLSSGSITKLVRGTSSGPQIMVGIEEDPEASRQLPPSDVLVEGFTVPAVCAAPDTLCIQPQAIWLPVSLNYIDPGFERGLASE